MKRVTPTKRLRQAVQECGLSQAELARRSGLPESVISRFARGITSVITSDTIDALCAALGLELTKRRAKR